MAPTIVALLAATGSPSTRRFHTFVEGKTEQAESEGMATGAAVGAGVGGATVGGASVDATAAEGAVEVAAGPVAGGAEVAAGEAPPTRVEVGAVEGRTVGSSIDPGRAEPSVGPAGEPGAAIGVLSAERPTATSPDAAAPPADVASGTGSGPTSQARTITTAGSGRPNIANRFPRRMPGA
jgi:hypothetical protein